MSDDSHTEGRDASEQDRYDDLDDDSQEHDSEESDTDAAHGFLDMEAAESEGLYEGEDEDEDWHKTEQHFFPHFTRLPPELRALIWSFFDPYLKAKTRLLELHVAPDPLAVFPSVVIAEQTAPARAMLATHKESRQLALMSYPDIIPMYDEATGSPEFHDLRYNRERDIVYLGLFIPSQTWIGFDDAPWLEDVKYLAADQKTMKQELGNLLLDLPNLKVLYALHDEDVHRRRDIRWCASDHVHAFSVDMTEEDYVYEGATLRYLYCWPDLDNHRKFAEENVTTDGMFESPVLGTNFESWPMVRFEDESGMRAYESLRRQVLCGDEASDYGHSSDAAHSSESETPDEYESEGIDDATIDGDDDQSEDENDLIVVQSSSDEDEMSPSPLNRFSPLQDEDPELDLGEEVGVAKFSSLEPQSPVHGGDDSEHVISDDEPVRTVGRHKRRIVSSDDENDSEDEHDIQAKLSSRPTKRSRVISDTEDEEDDDENDDEENDDEDGGAGNDLDAIDGSQNHEGSEEDEFDGFEDEPAKAKSLSLFEKLNQFREEHPIPLDSDTSSHADTSISGGDNDGRNDIDFSDDEIDEEENMGEYDEEGTDLSEGHSEGEEDGW
ncbi:hypothetical protein GGR54DRAFT_436007 [Hypoxylon sp. NC1633]|nr:hypothetical protein GGR54DRAFT_436007 [Hypoxylon sp. NC1633]